MPFNDSFHEMNKNALEFALQFSSGLSDRVKCKQVGRKVENDSRGNVTFYLASVGWGTWHGARGSSLALWSTLLSVTSRICTEFALYELQLITNELYTIDSSFWINWKQFRSSFIETTTGRFDRAWDRSPTRMSAQRCQIPTNSS